MEIIVKQSLSTISPRECLMIVWNMIQYRDSFHKSDKLPTHDLFSEIDFLPDWWIFSCTFETGMVCQQGTLPTS